VIRACLLSVAAAALVFVAGVGTASAATVEECQAQLATLRSDTVAAAPSFANPKDAAALVAKLDETAEKLAAGKNADAAAKLAEYQARLNALATAPKPKIDPALAQTLAAQAQGVAACIDAIATA
jgi:hypothetical protein